MANSAGHPVRVDDVPVALTAKEFLLLFQRPMIDVFDLRSSGRWSYAAEASTVLATTTLALAQRDPGVRFAAGHPSRPGTTRPTDGVTAGFDFSEADQVPPLSSTECFGPA